MILRHQDSFDIEDVVSEIGNMRITMQDRLLKRELGQTARYSAVKGIYGDRAWIDDLDVVNELGGHSGCVNALRRVHGL